MAPLHSPAPHELIRRDGEFQVLLERLDKAAGGKGGVILLAGPAGIGKSMLVEAVLRERECTAGRGHNFHQSAQALACFAGALRGVLQELRLSPDSFSATARAAWDMVLPGAGCPSDDATPEEVLAALGETIANLAERSPHPLVLVLEDLQAADSLTLEAIFVLSQALQGQRVLLLGTYRDEDVPPRLRWMRNELRRMRSFHEIALSPFDIAATGDLLQQVLGRRVPAATVAQIHARTGGIPFYIRELATGLEAGASENQPLKIPETLRDAVLADVERLSPRARTFIEWAAVAGVAFELALVQEASGDQEAVDELFARKLITEGESGTARFRHQLTQEAICEQLERGTRRVFHRRLATLLEARSAPPEVIAGHWLGAGENDRACTCLLRAAEQACASFAFWDATDWIRRAFQICPDAALRAGVDLLERYAKCAQLSGQLQEAAITWKRVATLLKEDREPPRYAASQRALATIYELQGKLRESIQCRNAAQEVFASLSSWGEAAVEALSCSSAHLTALQTALAENKAREAVSLARKAKDGDLLLRSEGILGLVLAMRGKTEEADGILQKSLQAALRGQKADIAAELYRWLGAVQEYRSDFKGAAAFYESVVEGCRSRGAKSAAYACMGCLSWVMFRTGDWNRAAAICRDVIGSQYTPDLSRSVAEGVLGTIQTLRGELRSARRHLLRCLDLADRLGIVVIVLIGRWGMALLEEMEGNHGETAAVYRELLDLWDRSEDRHDAIAPLSYGAEFFCRVGEESDAGRCVAALQQIASETGNAEALGAVALAAGDTASSKGDFAPALAHFRQAMHHWEGLDVPFELARAEWRAGIAAAETGDAGTSEQLLHRALQRFRRLGARTHAARVAERLGEKTEPPVHAEPRRDRATAAAPINLTPRQRDVARLVSEGLTYKEIAAKLFLSPRTVEMHAASLLDRTNSRSRSEVVRKLQEQSLL